MSDPYCYRDARTDEWRAVAARIGAERLYRTTGVQLMAINTIFQLAAHDRRELARARQLLLMPELVVHELTGVRTGERTSAGTTALVDLATGAWSRDLLAAIDVDPAIMPAISQATSDAGSWHGVPVYLVGGHDTASAVAALPSPRPNAAFISSGTWMLVGQERDTPDVSEAAMRANFSNEAGVFGNVRFLKNIMGLWMLERCRTQWGDPPLDDLLSAAATLPTGGPTVDATDARFLAPKNMETEVRDAARLAASAGRAVVARCILDSLAAAAAGVVRDIESIAGTAVEEIVVVGGGARISLLNHLIEGASGVSVRVGPSEATLLGNALVQGISLGTVRLAGRGARGTRPLNGFEVSHTVDWRRTHAREMSRVRCWATVSFRLPSGRSAASRPAMTRVHNLSETRRWLDSRYAGPLRRRSCLRSGRSHHGTGLDRRPRDTEVSVGRL